MFSMLCPRFTVNGLTVQQRFQYHRQELCLVQRDAIGPHISGRVLAGQREGPEPGEVRAGKEENGGGGR